MFNVCAFNDIDCINCLMVNIWTNKAQKSDLYYVVLTKPRRLIYNKEPTHWLLVSLVMNAWQCNIYASSVSKS